MTSSVGVPAACTRAAVPLNFRELLRSACRHCCWTDRPLSGSLTSVRMKVGEVEETSLPSRSTLTNFRELILPAFEKSFIVSMDYSTLGR